MGSEYMIDASGVYADYLRAKIIAGDSDYYGYHNAESVGKMEVALDLITLVRTLEDPGIGEVMAYAKGENQYAANAMRMFLQQVELWDDADRLYDRLCLWRKTRFLPEVKIIEDATGASRSDPQDNTGE